MIPLDYDNLCNTLSMTEIIRLQTILSTALIRRFERPMTVAFSDIVGSTAYFAKFGDIAGRQMQQRHIDLLQLSIGKVGGRIVDTAGDGAFLCFQSVDDSSLAMVNFLGLVATENTGRAREQQLAVRIGIHHGPVLTDGVQVTGESVNFCARITGSAEAGEIRLSKAAFLAMTRMELRLKCRNLPPIMLKGIDRPADLMALDWRDRTQWPASVRLETGQEFILPEQDIVSFGRLKQQGGAPGNDIVLQCRDESHTVQISRWHFELRRKIDGWVIRSVTAAPTEVNGEGLAKGDERPIRPGDQVRVGNVLSLQIQGPPAHPEESDGDRTIIHEDPTPSSRWNPDAR